MNTPTIHPLIIIGSGPAGLTAAIYASRSNIAPIIIEGNTPGGQLMGTTLVENWPGEKSILGPKLMQNMREHALHFNTIFIADEIASVNTQSRPFTLTFTSGKTMQAHCIIVATGATPKRLGCPGENEYWGKGVTTCAVCDGAFYPDKQVMVVGGGDTAMEDASFLRKFTDKITIVQIEDSLSATHAMQQRVVNDPHIRIIYTTAIQKIEGDGTRVTGVTLLDKKTSQISHMPIDALFVAIGLNPNTAFLKGNLECTPAGYIKLSGTTGTSVPGIFAAGDVADSHYRQAVTSAGSGCMAALDAERYLKSHNLIA
jgi:thioredoxin reductase (NADPH)